MTANIIAIIAIPSIIFMFVIVFATLYGIKKRKDLKSAIADRKARGEKYDDLTGNGIFSSWLDIFSKEDGESKSSLSVLMIVIVYIVIHIAFARLHPIWFARYCWHRPEFFIICQFYAGAMIALLLIRFGGFIRFMLGLVFTIILGWYVWNEWPKPPKGGGDTENVVATQPEYVLLDRYGEWIVEIGPHWSKEYRIPSGKRLTRQPIDEKMPFTYWLTLTDGSKKIVNIPPENKMGGRTLQLPDCTAIRMMSPEKTKMVLIVEKY
jgi:hypothetical protein